MNPYSIKKRKGGPPPTPRHTPRERERIVPPTPPTQRERTVGDPTVYKYMGQYMVSLWLDMGYIWVGIWLYMD